MKTFIYPLLFCLLFGINAKAQTTNTLLILQDSSQLCYGYIPDGYVVSVMNLLIDTSQTSLLDHFELTDSTATIEYQEIPLGPVIIDDAYCQPLNYHVISGDSTTHEFYSFYLMDNCDSPCGPMFSSTMFIGVDSTNGVWCDPNLWLGNYELLVTFPFTDTIQNYIETEDPDATITVLPSSNPGEYYDIMIISENGYYNYSFSIPLVDTCSTFMSLNEIDEQAIGLYPNPVKDILYLDTELDIQQVMLFDAFGKELIRKNMDVSDQSIDLSAFPKGVYILHLIGDNINSNHKIIKD